MCCLAVGRAPEKTRFFISHKPHYENSSTNIVTGQEKERKLRDCGVFSEPQGDSSDTSYLQNDIHGMTWINRIRSLAEGSLSIRSLREVPAIAIYGILL